MSDEAPAEEHQKLASAKYARIIVYICGFILLGLIAADRQVTTTLGMRHELVLRRGHVKEMLRRLAHLEKPGDDLFLMAAAYHSAAGVGEVWRDEEGSVKVRRAVQPPTGILGNYERSGREDAWGLSDEERLRAVREFAARIRAARPPAVMPEDRESLRMEVSRLNEVLMTEELVKGWQRARTYAGSESAKQKEEDVRGLIAKVMTKAHELSLREGERLENRVWAAANALWGFWGSGDSLYLNEETADAAVREELFRPHSGSIGMWPEEQQRLVKVIIESQPAELSEEEVWWLATGEAGFADLEEESWGARRLGLGYVEEDGAVSDLPVFSAYEFIGKKPAEVRRSLLEYETALEKALLTKSDGQNSIQVLGSGVSLRLVDLVVFAGPLLALFQVLYLITVAQERRLKLTPAVGGEAAYPQFPRFSGPADPLRGPWPRSTPEAFERLLYLLFLLAPTSMIFCAWLTNFNLFNVQDLLDAPFWRDAFLDESLKGPARSSGKLRGLLYISAIAISSYCLHLAARDEKASPPRFRRAFVAVLPLTVVGLFCLWFWVDRGAGALIGGGAILAVCVAGLWRRGRNGNRWLWVVLGVLMWLGMCASVLYRALDPALPEREANLEYLWKVIVDFLSMGFNVLIPFAVVSAGVAAGVRRRQRLTTAFFLFMLVLLAGLVLLAVSESGGGFGGGYSIGGGAEV